MQDNSRHSHLRGFPCGGRCGKFFEPLTLDLDTEAGIRRMREMVAMSMRETMVPSAPQAAE